MAKYRLMAQHVIDGGLREAGTEVGDGCQIPYSGEPTPHMVGLDAEGKKKVADVLERHFSDPANTPPGFHQLPVMAEPEPEPKPKAEPKAPVFKEKE